MRGDCRSFIRIGKGSNIQEHCCIHVPFDGATIVGDHVSVGHGAILHGCTIGSGTLVGMGAVVLDGAVIGENCLIGAGALVTGTANIPDGMLVLGSPAKAVRPLREEELQSLEENAQEYIVMGQEMADQGILSRGVAPMTSLKLAESPTGSDTAQEAPRTSTLFDYVQGLRDQQYVVFPLP